MLGNSIEMRLIFRPTLGPLVLGWAPNCFVLGAQFAPGEKRLVCIPVWANHCCKALTILSLISALCASLFQNTIPIWKIVESDQLASEEFN